MRLRIFLITNLVILVLFINQSLGFDLGGAVNSIENHLTSSQDCVETKNWDDDAEPTITCSEKKDQQGLEQTQQ
jgi:hypothetical protein